MLKKSIIPIFFASLFLLFTTAFWYVVRRFYNDPFGWFSFAGTDQDVSLLILSTVGMVVFASLLFILKPSSTKIISILGIATAIQFIFIPFGWILIVSAAFFFFGFWRYLAKTNKAYHNHIKIDFWDTYSRTIPGLITFLTITIALITYQASTDKAQTFRVTIPEKLIEQTINFTTPNEGALQFVQGINLHYRELLIQNTKNELEQQIDEQLYQWRPFIPLVNTLAIFFLIGIINFPVMLLSTLVVSGIMYLMKQNGLITVVKVQEEVERLAW